MAETADSSIEQAVSALSLKNLVAGFHRYRVCYASVWRLRGRFVADTGALTAPNFLSLAIETYLYGVAVSFALYSPVIRKFQLDLGKLLFLLQFIYHQALLVLTWHCALKVVRGKGTLAQTAAIYCIWMGIVSPTLLLLGYPLFWHLGAADFIAPNAVNDVPMWVLVWNCLVFVGMWVVALTTIFKWLPDAHGIRRRWMLVAMPLSLAILAVHAKFVAPLGSSAVKVIANVLESLV